MAKKTSIVTPLLKANKQTGETKVIRIRISVDQYNNLMENAKNTGLSANQLALMALEETDVLDKVAPKSDSQSDQ